MNQELNVDNVRARFPGLDSGWIFFNNAGGTRMVSGVSERVNEREFFNDLQSVAGYSGLVGAAESLHRERASITQLLNASRAEEIRFFATATNALQNLALAIGPQLNPGDEIIVSLCEHQSNMAPWMELERMGVKLRLWEVRLDSLQLELEDLEHLLTPSTRLVAVTQTSNVLGTINPVAEIAKRVHARGALLCVDAVAFAPHRAIDVQALDADFLVIALHKLFGPHCAALYTRHALLARFPQLADPRHVGEESAKGANAVVDYLAELGEQVSAVADANVPLRERIIAAYRWIARYEGFLAEQILGFLRSREDCRILGFERGDDPRRVATISFTVRGRDAGGIARALIERRIAVGFGDFHSPRLLAHLGLNDGNGVVRISPVHYNTLAEVASLIGALRQVLDSAP